MIQIVRYNPRSRQSTACFHTGAVLENKPDQVLRNYDLVKSRNVRVDELSVVVDLAGKVRIVLLSRLENDLVAHSHS